MVVGAPVPTDWMGGEGGTAAWCSFLACLILPFSSTANVARHDAVRYAQSRTGFALLASSIRFYFWGIWGPEGCLADCESARSVLYREAYPCSRYQHVALPGNIFLYDLTSLSEVVTGWIEEVSDRAGLFLCDLVCVTPAGRRAGRVRGPGGRVQCECECMQPQRAMSNFLLGDRSIRP